MVESYLASDTFRSRAQGTQKVYKLTLDRIVDTMGKLRVEAVTRKHVRHVLATIPGNASRNLFVGTLGALYKWGRAHDMTEANPVAGIEKYEVGEHEPWPLVLLDAALAAEDDTVRLAVHLLFYTGQRLGDVAKLHWSAIYNGRLNLRQQKTGKDVSMPLAKPLAAELARTPNAGLFIIAHPNGRPYSIDAIRAKLKAFCAERGYDRVPHGLRKNAVNALLEEGCTISEVQAITGQSMEIVAHYAKGVDRDKLADAAILKFDRRNK
jgi:integrase